MSNLPLPFRVLLIMFSGLKFRVSFSFSPFFAVFIEFFLSSVYDDLALFELDEAPDARST